MIPSMRVALGAVALVLAVPLVAAQTVTTPPTTTAAAVPTITAVSECHPHGTTLYCMSGTAEWPMKGPTKTEEFQSEYTSCHNHGKEVFCVDKKGEDIQVLIETEEAHEEEPKKGEEKHCHFHSGVEHCVGGDTTEEKNCELVVRDYNIPLRVGLIFVILATSGIGVFLPIIATAFTKITTQSTVFIILRQFGTGVVLSTAFVHLYTHATLMFANDCLGELLYEGVTSAVVLAGIFLSFLIDYLGVRFIQWKQARTPGAATPVLVQDRPTSQDASPEIKSVSGTPSDTIIADEHGHGHGLVQGQIDQKLSVAVLEAGIVFHSILIGVTLVVAGDSYFLTLFAVIVFHQMFEGIALGTAIASLPESKASFLTKSIMGAIFAIITPIGMAIGIGCLKQWNGNDRNTIIAIGTLDAVSAGILIWVGVVELLARDWLQGPLLVSGPAKTGAAMLALIAGMALMSFLGKWA